MKSPNHHVRMNEGRREGGKEGGRAGTHHPWHGGVVGTKGEGKDGQVTPLVEGAFGVAHAGPEGGREDRCDEMMVERSDPPSLPPSLPPPLPGPIFVVLPFLPLSEDAAQRPLLWPDLGREGGREGGRE